MKRVVLVGATDGIGRALASEYLVRGWRVGLVGRDPAKLDRVQEELAAEVPEGAVSTVVHDLAEPDDARPAFERLLEALGQLDLLVYCAGVMPPAGSAEERRAGVEPLMAVNLTGAVHWIELAADYLVGVGKGRVAAVGSVAGDRGRGGEPTYGASKAALHHYLEGLRHRLHGTGVGVSTVKPGWVRTRMLPDRMHASPLAVEPETAARLIQRGLEARRDVFYVPARWWWVATALKLMPRWLYKRVAPS